MTVEKVASGSGTGSSDRGEVVTIGFSQSQTQTHTHSYASDAYPKLNFLLLLLTSIAIWLWSDALTVELPFLVPYLPEGWRLGSFLVLMKGLSTLFLLLLPLFLHKGIVTACMICYGLGFVFSLSIAFSWDKVLPSNVTQLFPHGLSLGFLLNAFILMGLDSVRMTLIYMLASHMFSENFFTAVLLGDSFGGLLASGVSYVQGYKEFFHHETNRNPTNNTIVNQDELPIFFKGFFLRNQFFVKDHVTLETKTDLSTSFTFAPHVALLILGFLYTICFAALVILICINKRGKPYEVLSNEGGQNGNLHYEEIYEDIHSDSREENPEERSNETSSPMHSADKSSELSLTFDSETGASCSRQQKEEMDRELLIQDRRPSTSLYEIRIVRSVQEMSGGGSSGWPQGEMHSTCYKYYMWFVWFLASGSIFTLLPAFQSYSTIPYSQRCFILAVASWSLSFPFTAIFAHFVRIERVFSLSLNLLFHVVVSATLMYIASQSHNPPFKNEPFAEPTVIALWALQGSSGFYLFCHASHCVRKMNERAVQMGSIAAQCGDVAGAAISFILVNFTDIFKAPGLN